MRQRKSSASNYRTLRLSVGAIFSAPPADISLYDPVASARTEFQGAAVQAHPSHHASLFPQIASIRRRCISSPLPLAPSIRGSSQPFTRGQEWALIVRKTAWRNPDALPLPRPRLRPAGPASLMRLPAWAPAKTRPAGSPATPSSDPGLDVRFARGLGLTGRVASRRPGPCPSWPARSVGDGGRVMLLVDRNCRRRRAPDRWRRQNFTKCETKRVDVSASAGASPRLRRRPSWRWDG